MNDGRIRGLPYTVHKQNQGPRKIRSMVSQRYRKVGPVDPDTERSEVPAYVWLCLVKFGV